MKKLALLLAIALAIPFVVGQPAVDFHQFYGNVDGVSDGSEIQAHINDHVYTTTVKNSKYGYNPLFLLGQGNDGDTITFYVKERKAKEYEFQQGGVTKLNLAYPLTEEEQQQQQAAQEQQKAASKKKYTAPPPAPEPEPAAPAPDCYDDWFCQPWEDCIGGIQTRTCAFNDYPECDLAYPQPAVQQACTMPVPAASCVDGIQNQGEEGIDCGGPCPLCPTCHDGRQNQGETGIDCGGPCRACPELEMPVVIVEKPSFAWVWILIGFLLLMGLAISAVVFFEKRHKKDVLDTRYKDVREYVQKYRKKGVSKQKIESALRKEGWKEDDIKKLL